MTDPTHPAPAESGIRNGIEYFAVGDVEEMQCARCGSSATWRDCPNCIDGFSHHDCGEDTCCCGDDEPNVACEWCTGAGGSAHCISSPEWCAANPIVGRDYIESTALRAEAWHD